MGIKKLGFVKILKVECGVPYFKPHSKRRMQTTQKMVCKVYTQDDGVITVVTRKDFVTDFRSGGWFIDLFLPHFGNLEYTQAVLVHDSLFASNKVSEEVANQIFLFMLERSGLSEWRSHVAFEAVSSPFGDHAYIDVDKYDVLNRGRVQVNWGAR